MWFVYGYFLKLLYTPQNIDVLFYTISNGGFAVSLYNVFTPVFADILRYNI